MLNISRLSDTPIGMTTPPLSPTLSLVRSGSSISCSLLAGASHTHFLSPHAQFKFQPETRPQKLLKTKTKLTQYTRIKAYAMTSRQTSSNPTAAVGVWAKERKCERGRPQIYRHAYICTARAGARSRRRRRYCCPLVANTTTKWRTKRIKQLGMFCMKSLRCCCDASSACVRVCVWVWLNEFYMYLYIHVSEWVRPCVCVCVYLCLLALTLNLNLSVLRLLYAPFAAGVAHCSLCCCCCCCYWSLSTCAVIWR